MNKTEKTTMSVREMGQIPGLSKTESYWLVHKQCFETTHARQVIMGLGKSNVWRHIFADIFHRFTAVTE